MHASYMDKNDERTREINWFINWLNITLRFRLSTFFLDFQSPGEALQLSRGIIIYTLGHTQEE